MRRKQLLGETEALKLSKAYSVGFLNGYKRCEREKDHEELVKKAPKSIPLREKAYLKKAKACPIPQKRKTKRAYEGTDPFYFVGATSVGYPTPNKSFCSQSTTAESEVHLEESAHALEELPNDLFNNVLAPRPSKSNLSPKMEEFLAANSTAGRFFQTKRVYYNTFCPKIRDLMLNGPEMDFPRYHVSLSEMHKFFLTSEQGTQILVRFATFVAASLIWEPGCLPTNVVQTVLDGLCLGFIKFDKKKVTRNFKKYRENLDKKGGSNKIFLSPKSVVFQFWAIYLTSCMGLRDGCRIRGHMMKFLDLFVLPCDRKLAIASLPEPDSMKKRSRTFKISNERLNITPSQDLNNSNHPPMGEVLLTWHIEIWIRKGSKRPNGYEDLEEYSEDFTVTKPGDPSSRQHSSSVQELNEAYWHDYKISNIPLIEENIYKNKGKFALPRDSRARRETTINNSNCPLPKQVIWPKPDPKHLIPDNQGGIHPSQTKAMVTKIERMQTDHLARWNNWLSYRVDSEYVMSQCEIVLQSDSALTSIISKTTTKKGTFCIKLGVYKGVRIFMCGKLFAGSYRGTLLIHNLPYFKPGHSFPSEFVKAEFTTFLSQLAAGIKFSEGSNNPPNLKADLACIPGAGLERDQEVEWIIQYFMTDNTVFLDLLRVYKRLINQLTNETLNTVYRLRESIKSEHSMMIKRKAVAYEALTRYRNCQPPSQNPNTYLVRCTRFKCKKKMQLKDFEPARGWICISCRKEMAAKKQTHRQFKQPPTGIMKEPEELRLMLTMNGLVFRNEIVYANKFQEQNGQWEYVQPLDELNTITLRKTEVYWKRMEYPGLELYKFPSPKNWGVIATRDLPAFTLLMDYTGVCVTQKEETQLEENLGESHYKFRHVYAESEQNRLVCIPFYYSNLAPFVNSIDSKSRLHKKAYKNVEVMRTVVDGSVRILMYSTKKILNGIELLYDYNGAYKAEQEDVPMFDTSGFIARK